MARHHPGLTIRRSSDTWNEEQHVAHHNPASASASAQPHYTSQYTPHHTSHARPPPSSPPRHVNDSGHHPINIYHAPLPYSRPDALPATQSGRTYRRADLTSPYRPATFTEVTEPPPRDPNSRSGIESFLRRPHEEEEARNNALNQSILDTNSQVIDSDNDSDDDDDENEDMPLLSRAAGAASNTVDLTQSPNIPTTRQSRTRKRNSSSDGGASGSAKKRTRRVVVDVDECFEEEAPSADAELLQAQQADALKMQETNKEDAVVRIGKRNCIICLENYTNATTASCGKHYANRISFSGCGTNKNSQDTSSATNV